VPRKPNPPPDDAEQAARFIEAAKALEADKSGKAFARALDVIVPVPGKGPAKKPKAKK
jgi:hypothetical protein